LTSLRKIQASGQLLVTLGGFIAFISISKQIPLLSEQAQLVKQLQAKVNCLEKACGYSKIDRPY
jgi:hypothetical protein